MRYPHSLARVALLVFIAFATRAASLDSQSLWRDEGDALCYAYEFPAVESHKIVPG